MENQKKKKEMVYKPEMTSKVRHGGVRVISTSRQRGLLDMAAKVIGSLFFCFVLFLYSPFAIHFCFNYNFFSYCVLHCYHRGLVTIWFSFEFYL